MYNFDQDTFKICNSIITKFTLYISKLIRFLLSNNELQYILLLQDIKIKKNKITIGFITLYI